MKLRALIEESAERLTQAGVSFGHGTTNALDEAAWLVLWRLHLPLDTPIDTPADGTTGEAAIEVDADHVALCRALISERITSRKPAAYLTHEAWLQGVAFYVDERVIVPRSLIAELLVDGGFDYWLHESTHTVLDLCTGNGSLAIIAAQQFPDIVVDAVDISTEALSVAAINVERHGLQDRIRLMPGDGLQGLTSAYDLIICNPPYVSAHSMGSLPAEYRAEPALALDGNTGGNQDGMDFVRPLLASLSRHLNPGGVLVLEIGNERAFFEAAFPSLDVVWLPTSAGEDQVLLITREALTA